MICRANYKRAKQREKPSRCRCNTEAVISEATARQVNRADLRASETQKETIFNDFE